MIKVDRIEVTGIEPAIRGMRNPMNSWDKSDSFCTENAYGIVDCMSCGDFEKCARYNGGDDVFLQPYRNGYLRTDEYIGPNDLKLAKSLSEGGGPHAKYRRMIVAYMDITAPLYWWKEFDTYKIGTVANSCSTMHKIQEKEFTLDDFSHEHLFQSTLDNLQQTIKKLNFWRDIYNHGGTIIRYGVPTLEFESKNKDVWWQMIQLLPSSYNQKRTVMLNYEVIHEMYKWRKDHKQDEWRELCEIFKNHLPYPELFIDREE